MEYKFVEFIEMNIKYYVEILFCVVDKVLFMLSIDVMYVILRFM